MAIRVIQSFAEADPRQWNALDLAGSPFLRHEFLLAAELSGSAVPATGWHPRHVLLEDATGHLVGAVPLYLKTHSFGEFVFDFTWAEASELAGHAWYPKLVAAVPFTPATGPRLLVHPAADAAATRRSLLTACRELRRELGASSLHLLFVTDAERDLAAAEGLLPRVDCQYHWHNAGYADFPGFLAGFTAARRKKLRRERRRVAEAGITLTTLHGGDLDTDRLRLVHRLHAGTFLRHGQSPYCTLDFFTRLARTMPEALVVQLASQSGEVVGCSLSLRSADTLYGRYWGAVRDIHSLHFETCYYRGIEYCIRERLARFEPGAQGEYKLLRGFAPQPTWSLHEVAEPRLAAALARSLARERVRVLRYVAAAAAHLPFRQDDAATGLDADAPDHLAPGV